MHEARTILGWSVNKSNDAPTEQTKEDKSSDKSIEVILPIFCQITADGIAAIPESSHATFSSPEKVSDERIKSAMKVPYIIYPKPKQA